MIWKSQYLPNEWIWKASACGTEKITNSHRNNRKTSLANGNVKKIAPKMLISIHMDMCSRHASEETQDYSPNIHTIAKCLDIKLLAFLSSQSNHIIRNPNKDSADALCNVLISMNAKTFEMWWFMGKSQSKLWFNDTLIHVWDACEKMWMEFQFWQSTFDSLPVY